MTTPTAAATWRHLTALALLLALVAGLLWGVPRLVEYSGLRQDSAPALVLTPSACDLNRGSCHAGQDGKTLEFSLGPAPIASLKPLRAEVRLKGIKARAVTLLLEGRDMYMGLNETRLVAQDGSDQWHGTTELAVCSTGRMVWRARLLIDADDNNDYETWFDFEAR